MYYCQNYDFGFRFLAFLHNMTKNVKKERDAKHKLLPFHFTAGPFCCFIRAIITPRI